MSGPIVFISHHRIKAGKADQLKALNKEMWSRMERETPQTLMNLAYVNDDETEVTFMHAFADIDAMQLHWQAAAVHAQQAYQHIHPVGFEIYGDAGDQIIEGMRSQSSAAGATLTLFPEFMNGFLRLAPGQG